MPSFANTVCALSLQDSGFPRGWERGRREAQVGGASQVPQTHFHPSCFTCVFYILEFPHRFHLEQKGIFAAGENKKKKVWKPSPNFKFPLMLRKPKPREGRWCTEVHTAGKLQSPDVACTTHSVVLFVILETFCTGSPRRQHLHSGFQCCFPLTWKLAWNHSPLAKCLLCAPSSLTCSLSKLLAECLGQGAL